jgi:Na+/glutamate symporter
LAPQILASAAAAVGTAAGGLLEGLQKRAAGRKKKSAPTGNAVTSAENHVARATSDMDAGQQQLSADEGEPHVSFISVCLLRALRSSHRHVYFPARTGFVRLLNAATFSHTCPLR